MSQSNLQYRVYIKAENCVHCCICPTVKHTHTNAQIWRKSNLEAAALVVVVVAVVVTAQRIRAYCPEHVLRVYVHMYVCICGKCTQRRYIYVGTYEHIQCFAAMRMPAVSYATTPHARANLCCAKTLISHCDGLLRTGWIFVCIRCVCVYGDVGVAQ